MARQAYVCMILALSLLCARDAAAGWLYWTTDFDSDWDNAGTLQDHPSPGVPNTQVWLVAQQGDDRENRQFLTDVNGKTVYTMTEDYPLVNDWMGQVAQTDLSAYSDGTYSFYVEMGVSNAGEYHGYYKSESFSYEDLVAAGHVVADIEALKTPWNAAVGDVPWSHTPEPSGGLLTLVGTALLLLRRRRGIGKVIEADGGV